MRPRHEQRDPHQRPQIWGGKGVTRVAKPRNDPRLPPRFHTPPRRRGAALGVHVSPRQEMMPSTAIFGLRRARLSYACTGARAIEPGAGLTHADLSGAKLSAGGVGVGDALLDLSAEADLLIAISRDLLSALPLELQLLIADAVGDRSLGQYASIGPWGWEDQAWSAHLLAAVVCGATCKSQLVRRLTKKIASPPPLAAAA